MLEATLASATLLSAGAFASPSRAKKLKVGVIGCGGRGSGAVSNCMEADPDVELYAVGDLFPDHVTRGLGWIGQLPASQMNVGDRKFTGFDAYKKVLATDVDVVILATPPGFRSIHFEAAIAAGKHVFMEKPVAVDAEGIRRVFAAADLAKKKNLSVVAGTQRRSDVAYNDAIKRIKDGAIGDVVSLHAYWMQGGLWKTDRTAEMSDTEWMIRNWLYFAWLSGDHIVEQHVHNLDVCNWIMGGPPVSAISLAGREVRRDPSYGHIFDHFATEYEYANGVRMTSMCRQIDNCVNRVSEFVVGSKGRSDANNWIDAGKKKWKFAGNRPNPYVEEHRKLIKSIRDEAGFNEGRQVAESTLTALMGRVAGYTGQQVKYDTLLNSNMGIFPDHVDFGPFPMPAVAVPGKV